MNLFYITHPISDLQGDGYHPPDNCLTIKFVYIEIVFFYLSEIRMSYQKIFVIQR